MLQLAGKTIIILGILIIIIGGFLYLGGKFRVIPFPGDIFIKGDKFIFYFPVVLSIIASIVITIVINIIRR